MGFLVPLALFLVAVLFLRRGKSAAELAGDEGEEAMADLLNRMEIPAVHDIYLPRGRGWTQIDHIAFLGDKLVVIETKNYQGRITGGEADRVWTRRARNRLRFPNPILQNWNHVKAVQEHFPGCPVLNMVAFVGSATFPDGLPFRVYDRERISEALAEARRPATIQASGIWEDILAYARTLDHDCCRREHLQALGVKTGGLTVWGKLLVLGSIGLTVAMLMRS